MVDIDWASVLTALTATAGIAVGIIGVAAFLGKALVSWVIDRQVARHKTELEKQKELAVAAVQAERDVALEEVKSRLGQQTKLEDHLRAEIRRWANPILGAVDGLISRLDNILDRDGYVALDPDAPPKPNWSVTHGYFLQSTIYLFCQYFCWTQLLRERLSFELFESHEEKDYFFGVQQRAARWLSAWPTPNGAPTENDSQVFLLQQRQMGEALIVESGDSHGCMRYAEFIEKWADPNFSARFEPLERLLNCLYPTSAPWWRLERTRAELREVRSECRNILKLSTKPNA